MRMFLVTGKRNLHQNAIFAAMCLNYLSEIKGEYIYIYIYPYIAFTVDSDARRYIDGHE